MYISQTTIPKSAYGSTYSQKKLTKSFKVKLLCINTVMWRKLEITSIVNVEIQAPCIKSNERCQQVSQQNPKTMINMKSVWPGYAISESLVMWAPTTEVTLAIGS